MWCAALLVPAALVATAADPNEKPKKIVATEAADAGPDFAVQGEYEGEVTLNSGPKKVGAQVVAKGNGNFDVRLLMGGLPGAGWDQKSELRATGKTEGGKVVLTGKDFSGAIAGGKLTGKDGGKLDFSLAKVERKSPTLGAKPPEGAVVLFDGTDASHWQKGKLYESPDGNKYLAVQKTGGLVGNEKFKDFTLHLEFRLPFMPEAGGQGRGNSGVYLMGRYEIQVLDNYNNKTYPNGQCGAFYGHNPPLVNACRKPGEWQSYDIVFHAPKRKADGQAVPGSFTVIHNGVLIQDHIPVGEASTTAAPLSGFAEKGPLYLQDHGNPVHFRNIWIRKL
jgi:hypothetical protein